MNRTGRTSVGSFITRPGDLFAPAPYRMGTATFSGFVVDSSYERLNLMLEEQFGAVTGGECRFLALVPAVIVTYISIARSFSLAADPSQAGYYLERDLICWVLAAQFGKGSILPQRVGFCAPFVWVDHPAALIEGREGVGYPKGFGNISIPQSGEPPLYSCDAYVFPGDPNAQVALGTVNRMQPSTTAGPSDAGPGGSPAGSDGEFRESWTTGAQARAEILAALAEDPTGHRFHPEMDPIDLTREFSVAPAQNFLLRQFRSATNPADALYQEIVAAQFASVTFHGGGILNGTWTAEFPQLPALDLTTELGVQRSSPVRLAYEVTIDATLAPGSTVWSPPAAVLPLIRMTACGVIHKGVSLVESKLREHRGNAS